MERNKQTNRSNYIEKSLNVFRNNNASYIYNEQTQKLKNIAVYSRQKVLNYCNDVLESIKNINVRDCRKVTAGVLLTYLLAVSPIMLDTNNAYAGQKNKAKPSNISGTIESIKKQEVTIAVIDKGFNTNLPMFKGLIKETPGLEENNSKESHGTEVSSIIVNESKMYKTDIKIIPLNYLSDEFEDRTKAIKYAVDNGAKIISLSITQDTMNKERREEYQKVIDYAYQKNVIVVVSAGNDGPLYYENTLASLNHVICVGAVDKNNQPADFSSRLESVFVTDIGVNVPVVDSKGKMFNDDGTSFSTPIVAQKIAVLCSKYPKITVDQVREVIANKSVDLGMPGRDHETGYGIFYPEKVDKNDIPKKIKRDIEYPHINGVIRGTITNINKAEYRFWVIDEGKVDMSEAKVTIKRIDDVKINNEVRQVEITKNQDYYSLDFSFIEDGKYELTFYNVKDQYGNTLEHTKRYFTRDRVPVDVDIEFENFKNGLGNPELVMNISMSDNIGIKEYSMFFDGDIQFANNFDDFINEDAREYKFRTTIESSKLTEGKHLLEFQCFDAEIGITKMFTVEVKDGNVSVQEI